MDESLLIHAAKIQIFFNSKQICNFFFGKIEFYLFCNMLRLIYNILHRFVTPYFVLHFDFTLCHKNYTP